MAQPFRSRNGDFLHTVKGKPAVFIERLSGSHVVASPAYANEIAIAMARVHLSTQSFELIRQHSHNLIWVQNTANNLMQELNAGDKRLLTIVLAHLKNIPQNLPTGVIHADLFHDNALFDNGHISGIIDWYFAGVDCFALDIAIALNDWCLDENKLFNVELGQQFLHAYQQVRPLNEQELAAITLLQIQAATRFWLSRYLARKKHLSSTESITVKDPNEMKRLLTQLLNYTQS